MLLTIDKFNVTVEFVFNIFNSLFYHVRIFNTNTDKLHYNKLHFIMQTVVSLLEGFNFLSNKAF